ncbi:Chromate resistance protein ChrB [Rhodococcus sp. NPDC056960]|uniref:Chromate resistance protein ChrB n=1 Tax=Rhodococcus sp. NPDC056960 TaxID=3345982 RepID=UPI003626F4EB
MSPSETGQHPSGPISTGRRRPVSRGENRAVPAGDQVDRRRRGPVRGNVHRARQADWAEFLADGKYEAELDQEIRIGKFTLAEHEEDEKSLESLRRWHRDLQAGDVFGAANATEARAQLEQCVTRFEDDAEQVMAALHTLPEDGGAR